MAIYGVCLYVVRFGVLLGNTTNELFSACELHRIQHGIKCIDTQTAKEKKKQNTHTHKTYLSIDTDEYDLNF